MTPVNTDGNRNASWALSPIVGTWTYISATTTDVNGNTSEFALTRSVDAIAIPAEVANFVFGPPLNNKANLSWDSLAAPAGPATKYDIMRGALDEFPVGAGVSETCLQNDLNGISFSDGATPSAGAGFYYLIRGQNLCGVGTYGTQSDETPRVTSVCAP